MPPYVAWGETPGEALDTRSSPIPFTTAGEVTFLSVRFPALGRSETAYLDGAFVAPYLASSRDGNSFVLRRSGGEWPSVPTVHVEPMPPAPSPTGYRALLDLDFRTLPTHTFVQGLNTVGGVDFYLKNDGLANSPVFAIINGLGLRQTSADTSVEEAHGYNVGDIPRIVLYVPFDQFAAYNTHRPFQIQWKYAGAYRIGNWQCGVTNLLGIKNGNRTTQAEWSAGFPTVLDDESRRAKGMMPGGNNVYTNSESILSPLSDHVLRLSYSPDSAYAWIKDTVIPGDVMPDATTGAAEQGIGTTAYRTANPATDSFGAAFFSEQRPHVGTGHCIYTRLRVLVAV